MRTLLTCLLLCVFCSSIQALPVPEQGKEITRVPSVPMTIGLHGQHQNYGSLLRLAETTPETTPEPESGSLVIPGEEEDQKEKKCLNVCKKWGENCIINPRTGNRDCRRTCKEFGVECF